MISCSCSVFSGPSRTHATKHGHIPVYVVTAHMQRHRTYQETCVMDEAHVGMHTTSGDAHRTYLCTSNQLCVQLVDMHATPRCGHTQTHSYTHNYSYMHNYTHKTQTCADLDTQLCTQYLDMYSPRPSQHLDSQTHTHTHIIHVLILCQVALTSRTQHKGRHALGLQTHRRT